MFGFKRGRSDDRTHSRPLSGPTGSGRTGMRIHPTSLAGSVRLARWMAWVVLTACLGACAGTHSDPSLPYGSNIAALPLVEVPARRPGHMLAVMLSGDGNWADIDREVAATLADSGIAVVGLRSRSYLQDGRRSPAGLAEDVTAILRHYLTAWQRDSVVIIGYSRGADFVPFVANRLPADLRSRLALVAMLALAPNANFQFHWVDLLRDSKRDSDVPTLPEIARLGQVHALCIYGREETESACRSVDSTAVRTIERDGGHHFDGDYRALGVAVVNALHAWPPGSTTGTAR